MTASTSTACPGRQRTNRGTEVIRERLVEAAITEFAAHGFSGASTRSIAALADTHQPQINYHFGSKEELWREALRRLLGELDIAVEQHTDGIDRAENAMMFAGIVRGLVTFASQRPELNRIMMHEATTPGDRLDWLVDKQLEWRNADLRRRWEALSAAGMTAPVPADLIYHLLVGASSLVYANAPEARLFGIEPSGAAFVRAHADALVATLLPNS